MRGDFDNYRYEFIENDKEHLVDVYRDDEHILRGSYGVLGCYNVVNSTWIWSWNIRQIERDLTRDARRIKAYSKNLVMEPSITKDIEEDYYYGTNPSFFISYNSLDRLLDYCERVIGGVEILGRKTDLMNGGGIIVEYLLLKKIVQVSKK
ncbi:MAG: hypothetical protein Harvfovirus7_22 [Harvfovirus sp.]|uniref:Uncharacterized protein n=1 Tax=Harvfovirus sp. TaxID=2487768 RepID=A0A3G5A0V6_9VIRU|nr:MAG: hypothetical protein Harvfovirus7_22 [Harvfovirus sp.]